jgi:hypothetical protein
MNNNAQATKRLDAVPRGVGGGISRDSVGHDGTAYVANPIRSHDGPSSLLAKQRQGRKVMRVPALGHLLTHYIVFVTILLLVTLAVQGGI